MIDWLKVYHRAPYFSRVLAASARGYYLRRWRYGSETERLVEEAMERESWSASRWRAWQGERLSKVLHRAATQVPFYRELWQRRRRQKNGRSWAYLENWPILEKESVRENPRAFLADDCDPSRMFHEHTSGTTGKSLNLWWSRETVRAWYALYEARCRAWHGVSRRDHWAILGGQVVVPASQNHPPFWVWNHGLNQLYLSSYHLAPRFVPYYLDALQRHNVTYLLGYPSALHALAQETLHVGRRDIMMQVAVTNAEPLFDYQREAISQAFHCPVRETYGMAEIVAAASECEADALHIWPEVGVFEISGNESDHARAEGEGEFICTGLVNADMPLIRYRVGDRGSLAEQAKRNGCSCGRELPRLLSVDGRNDDVLITIDGRLIGRLDPIFKADLPIREAQIIQESLNRVRVRYVPTSDYLPENGRSVIERLQARMGPIEVVLEAVEAIPRTENGKFRAVVSNLSLEEKSRLRANMLLV